MVKDKENIINTKDKENIIKIKHNK